MKTSRRLRRLAVVLAPLPLFIIAALAPISLLHAAGCQRVPAAGVTATAPQSPDIPALIAAASQPVYPLRTCVVSGGKPGGMGKPVEYVHQQAGQPDRTVIFCCKSCIKKFENDPARFIARLDSAAFAAN